MTTSMANTSRGTVARSAAPEATLVLSIGRWGEWRAPRGVSVSVSNGSLVRVTDQGAHLKVTAKKLGVAEVRAGSARLTVFIVREPLRRLFEALASEIRRMRGLEIEMETDESKGPGIHVRGSLLRWGDWLALAEAAEGKDSFYQFEAQVSPEILGKAEAHFKKLLRDSYLPELALQLRPFAEATVSTESPELKARAERILGPFGFRLSASPSALNLEPLVRVRLVVAEFRKNMIRKLGLEWPSSADAQVLPKPTLPGLALRLHALEDQGLGKVLASPTLLCRSGKEAQFLAGGELPIRIVGRKTREISWKKYGVMLKIRPKADFSGRMSIGIETEVSMIDAANAVDGVPGLLTNRIESHFDLASSRTIVLSGLIKKEWSDSSSGLPGFSRIPILGSLFSSRDYRDNRTELVVFVTPELDRAESESL